MPFGGQRECYVAVDQRTLRRELGLERCTVLLPLLGEGEAERRPER